MRVRATVFCLAVAACAVAQQVPKKVYRVETSDPKDIRMEVVHGETINLQWTFLSYANPLDIESAAVTLHARTNGMAEGVSFQVPGAAGPGGVATVRLAVSEWLPTACNEAEWTLEVVQPDAARILRAKGTVTATRSAAASTNDPVPVVWLDDIRAEIGAVGAGIGPLRSRVETVEQGTNRWEAAWHWGDHSAMGYLLAAALDNYYTMPQVDGRIADATNSIVIPVRSVNSKTGDIVLTADDVGAITNEQDLAALRAHHYGDPNIVESPAEWFEFDATTGTITGFNWQAGREHVVIPWQIGGVPVVKLDRFMYLDGNGVVSVIAPKSVAVVNNSLVECSALTSVSLPNVTTVNGGFEWCSALTSVSLPNVTTVNVSFYYCSALTSVSLPNATTVNISFDSCSALTSVSLPNATTVYESPQRCSALTSVSLPNAATINYSLYDCSALTNVTFSGSPPEINEYTFYDSPNVTVYVDNPQATGWGETFGGRPVVRPPLYADNIYQGGDRVSTENYVNQKIAAAPEWLEYGGVAGALTVTNDCERPVRVTGAGDVAVGFAGLREPLPVYLELAGFSGVSWPGAHVVGGGFYQTNMVNIYVAWRSGTNVFINPVTARPQ